MVGTNTARIWGLKEYSFVCDNPEEQSKVTKIICIECQDFYSKWPQELDCLQGHIKKLANKESRQAILLS